MTDRQVFSPENDDSLPRRAQRNETPQGRYVPSPEQTQSLAGIVAAIHAEDSGESGESGESGDNHHTAVVASPPGRSRRRPAMAAMAAAAALVLVAAVAIGTTSSSDGDSAAAGAPSTANPNTAGGPEAEADTDDVNAVDPTTDTTDQAVTTEVEVLSATTAPPSADTPERLAATDVDASVRHGRYSDGKITLLGPVRDVATADRLVAAAGEVIGAENVINEYVIDPTAPETTDGLVIVDDPVLFAAGSAELNSDFFPLLDLGKIVLTLNEQATLRIVGHTDSLGDPANNQALSEARARAVADYIVAGGIAEDRLEVIGAGSAEPRESNDTAVGRAANRRIDVQILNLIS